MSRLGDDLNAMAVRVVGNKLNGSRVTLDSYSASDYTFPSDGYLSVECNAAANASAFAMIKDSSGTTINLMGCGNSNSTYATWATFVKKGMKVRAVEVANGGHVYFSPLGGGTA